MGNKVAKAVSISESSVRSCWIPAFWAASRIAPRTSFCSTIEGDTALCVMEPLLKAASFIAVFKSTVGSGVPEVCKFSVCDTSGFFLGLDFFGADFFLG